MKLLDPQQRDDAQEDLDEGLPSMTGPQIVQLLQSAPESGRLAVYIAVVRALEEANIDDPLLYQALLLATGEVPPQERLEALAAFARAIGQLTPPTAELPDLLMTSASHCGADSAASVATVVTALAKAHAPVGNYLASILTVIAPMSIQGQATVFMALFNALAAPGRSIGTSQTASLSQHLGQPGLWDLLVQSACAPQASATDGTAALGKLAVGLRNAHIATLALWSDLLRAAITLDQGTGAHGAVASVANEAAGLTRMDAPPTGLPFADALWMPLVGAAAALADHASLTTFLRLFGASRPPSEVRVALVTAVCSHPTVHKTTVTQLEHLTNMLWRSRDTRAGLWLQLVHAASTGADPAGKIQTVAMGAISSGVASIDVWKKFIDLKASLTKIATGLGLANCTDPAIWLPILERVRAEAPTLLASSHGHAATCMEAICSAMKGQQFAGLLRHVYALGPCFGPDGDTAPDWFDITIAGRLGMAGMAATSEGTTCLARLSALSGLAAPAAQALKATIDPDILLQLWQPLCKYKGTQSAADTIYSDLLAHSAGKTLKLGSFPLTVALRETAQLATTNALGEQTIQWKALETPGAFPAKAFCSFPQLEAAAGDLLATTKVLELKLGQAVRDSSSSSTNDPSLQACEKACKMLGGLLRQIANLPHTLNEQAWTHAKNADGLRQSIKMEQALLNCLLDKHRKLQPLTQATLADVIEITRKVSQDQAKLRDALAEMENALAELNKLLDAPDFADRYSNCYFYSATVLDKTPIDALLLGAEVGCCLAPDGGHFDAMVEREVNPAWVHVGVNNDRGSVVAVCWCCVCKNPQTGEVHLMVDFTDAKPSYTRARAMADGTSLPNPLGNAVVGQLLAYVADLGKAAGVACTYVGPQQYGRMEDFQVFNQALYTHELKLTPVCSTRSDEDDYTDNIGMMVKCRLLRPGARDG